MAIDKATIINWALTGIGAGPIFSIDDDSDLAEQIENTWQRVVDKCFGMHDWAFAMTTARLRRLADAPANGWPFGYDLPGDKIDNPAAYLRSIKPRELIRDFTLQKGKFYCHEPQAWAVYKTAVDPDYWDAPWRSAFLTALEGALAVPVWGDDNLRDSKFALAFGTPSQQGGGGEFGRLMAEDKASRPIGQESLLARDPLSDARVAGGGPLAGPWHGGL